MKSRHLTISAIGASLVALALASPHPREPLTHDLLSASFDAGLRNTVLRWDANDHRSAAERRRSLFEFVYETYDASAWIPQSLFDSNRVTQAVVGDVETIVGNSVGLVVWRDNPRVPAFGMAPNAAAAGREPLKWTVNCLVCHTAEIDGVAYFGAGTKTFDELWLGEALKRLTAEPWRGRLRGSTDYAAAADANPIRNSHHHDKIDSLTRAIDGVRSIERRDVHAVARQRDAGDFRGRPG